MAKIEMDLSEFKLLEENKSLLEQSLNREKALQASINKLNEEKIKVLEDAKMKVIKISRTETHENVLVQGNWYELYQNLKNTYERGSRDFRGYSEHPEYMIERFFRKSKSISYPSPDVVTMHGLDEVKAELKEELKREMDSDVAYKVKRAEEVLSRNSDLTMKNDDLKKSIAAVETSNNILTNKCEKLELELELLDADLTKINKRTVENRAKLHLIKEALNNTSGFWNRVKFVKIVKFVLKDPCQNH